MRLRKREITAIVFLLMVFYVGARFALFTGFGVKVVKTPVPATPTDPPGLPVWELDYEDVATYRWAQGTCEIVFWPLDSLHRFAFEQTGRDPVPTPARVISD